MDVEKSKTNEQENKRLRNSVFYLVALALLLLSLAYANNELRPLLLSAVLLVSLCHVVIYVAKKYIIKHSLAYFYLDNQHSKDLVFRALGQNKATNIYKVQKITRSEFNKVMKHRIRELTE